MPMGPLSHAELSMRLTPEPKLVTKVQVAQGCQKQLGPLPSGCSGCPSASSGPVLTKMELMRVEATNGGATGGALERFLVQLGMHI